MRIIHATKNSIKNGLSDKQKMATSGQQNNKMILQSLILQIVVKNCYHRSNMDGSIW